MIQYDRDYVVHGWRHENGISDPIEHDVCRLEPGWYCWLYIYNSKDAESVDWMERSMTGEYECIHRFNSGDPMYTIYIKEQRDAELFALKFIGH